MNALTSIYLDGRDLERDQEALMRFRLTYEGPLLSSKPHEPEKRAPHKHDIRRKFHSQLKEFWQTNKFLSTATMSGPSRGVLPPASKSLWDTPPGGNVPLAAALAHAFSHNNYRFTPLVWKEAFLFCSLRILCLRRDGPDAVLSWSWLIGQVGSGVKVYSDC